MAFAKLLKDCLRCKKNISLADDCVVASSFERPKLIVCEQHMGCRYFFFLVSSTDYCTETENLSSGETNCIFRPWIYERIRFVGTKFRELIERTLTKCSSWRTDFVGFYTAIHSKGSSFLHTFYIQISFKGHPEQVGICCTRSLPPDEIHLLDAVCSSNKYIHWPFYFPLHRKRWNCPQPPHVLA